MKVLQINTVCGTGSTGRIAVDIHNMLLQQGHESTIAYGREEAVGCDSAIKIGNKVDLYLHVLKTRLMDKHGFGSKRATESLVEKIRDYNPDIIHLHNIHGYYLNIEILFNFLKEFNKPIVWTLHDCWAFTGHCAHFDYIGCNKWKTHCEKCPAKKSYPKSIFLDSSYSNFENKRHLFTGLKNVVLVTPSQWLAGLIKESFLKNYHVMVINNGIDVNTFKPTPSDFRKRYNLKGKFVILGVANKWTKVKGFQYFMELSKELSKDEVIVLVGLSKKQLETLPENIIGIERTNSVTELAEIYSAADVFVNPTLEENYPTVNLEAQACGTPVITFNTGGSIETIDDTTGFIVEKGDLENAIKIIRKIKSEGKEKYSESCIKRANKYYNKNDKFQEYIELYKNLGEEVEL